MKNGVLILGIDPGRVKTGLALVEPGGAIVWRAIVPVAELRAQLEEVLTKNQVARIALGDSTASAETAALLKEVLEQSEATKNEASGEAPREKPRVEIVDERNSTLQARALYFEHHPPRGWRRLVPLGLQDAPEPLDDFAAVILTRRLEKLE